MLLYNTMGIKLNFQTKTMYPLIFFHSLACLANEMPESGEKHGGNWHHTWSATNSIDSNIRDRLRRSKPSFLPKNIKKQISSYLHQPCNSLGNKGLWCGKHPTMKKHSKAESFRGFLGGGGAQGGHFKFSILFQVYL